MESRKTSDNSDNSQKNIESQSESNDNLKNTEVSIRKFVILNYKNNKPFTAGNTTDR
jgi:hypothetical protein